MTNWIEWINANSMELNEYYNDEWTCPNWYKRMLDEVEEAIIQHYGDCDRKARLEWNCYCEQTTIKYIQDNYEDIIGSNLSRDSDWTRFGDYTPVQDLDDILEIQKFVMSQYDKEKLISDPNSPYWDKTGLFLLCILSREFIAQSIEHGHGPRLSIDEGGEKYNIDDLNWSMDRGGDTALCICQEDLDDLENTYMDIDNWDKPYMNVASASLGYGLVNKSIIKLQAICRGRNARWRCPLYLLTIS